MKKGKSHLDKKVINEVAAKLFGEKGFAETTMKDITNGLNVSVAAVYYYYKNKDELLFSIIDSIGNELLTVLEKAKDESDDPLQQLYNMVYFHIILTKDNKNKVKVYVEQQHNLSTKFRKIIYKQHRKLYDIYVDQLRKLQKAKLISCEPLSITALSIFGMLNWCYRWYREDKLLTIEEVGQRILDIIFHGILGTGKSVSKSKEKKTKVASKV